MQTELVENEKMLDGFDLPAGCEFEYPVGLVRTAKDGTSEVVRMDAVDLAAQLRAECKGRPDLLTRWPGIVVCLSDMDSGRVELLLDDVAKAMKLPKKVARGELLGAIADRNAAWAECERLAYGEDDAGALGEAEEDALERDALGQIERLRRSQELYARVKDIAADPLGELDKALTAMGVVGERPAAKTVFLAAASAHSDKPASVVVKGQSSTGKSFTVKTALKLSGTHVRTVSSLSAKAIIYDEPDSYSHAVVFLEEGEALFRKDGEKNDVAEMLRELLSEGVLRHATVERDPDSGRLTTRWVEQEGPTGLITTTTRGHLDNEIETRMLSVWLDESEAQTKAVMAATARAAAGTDAGGVDLDLWNDFAEYVRLGPRTVFVPFAGALAELMPSSAVRVRRDFNSILSLTKAAAMVHRAQRDLDADGNLLAQLEDYQVALDCIGDAVAEAHGLKLSENAETLLAGLRDKMIKPACQALAHPDGNGGTCWDDVAGCPFVLPVPPSGSPASTPPRTMNAAPSTVGYDLVENGMYMPAVRVAVRDLVKTLGLSKSTVHRYLAHVMAEGLIEYVDQGGPRRGRGGAGPFYVVPDAWEALASPTKQRGLPSVAQIKAKASGIF